MFSAAAKEISSGWAAEASEYKALNGVNSLFVSDVGTGVGLVAVGGAVLL